MPDDARTHEYKKYKFSGFYTQDYLEQATAHLLRELLRRKDLTIIMVERLQLMRSYLNNVVPFPALEGLK